MEMHNTANQPESVFEQLSRNISLVDVLDLNQLSQDDIVDLIEENNMTQEQEDTLVQSLLFDDPQAIGIG